MGGAEVHLHEIFRRIVKLGHQVTLVAHQFKGAPEEEIIDGIKIIRHGNKFIFNKQFKKFYKSQLENLDFDLIVDDISKIPLKIPQYVNKPVVGILHHIHGNSLYKELPFPLAYYIIHSEKRIPDNYNSVPIFTVSESTKSELVEIGYNRERIGLLHNAIDHNLFESVQVEKSPTPLITYIGRIKNYKNIDVILDAISILRSDIKDIKLIIGGKGDHLTKLQEKAAKLNLLNHIEFLGFLTEEEKAEILGKAWIFSTMAEKEGWGITVIEANAMGTPAIGSNVPGLRDSIQHNETGYLVPLNSAKQLAEKIKLLITNKSELERLSNNSLEWSKNFTWDKSAKVFLEKVVEWYPKLKYKLKSENN